MSIPKTLLVISACLFLATHSGQVDADTRLSRYKARKLERLGPFDAKEMVEVHSTMQDLFMRLWDSESREIVYEHESETFAPKYPILQLLDVDGDDIPEQFAYQTEIGGRASTQEFGFFFDLDQDNRVDYVIFYGGPMMSEGREPIWWMNYHNIDSNSDGRVDRVLFQGSTDLNGNGRVEPEVGLWFIDDDFDGLLDRAVYLAEDLEQAVRVRRGNLDLSQNLILNDNTVQVGDPMIELGDALLSDISQLLESRGN